MSISKKLMFNAYASAIAAVAVLAGSKSVEGLWRTVTHEAPPDPNDPAVPPAKAFGWVVANAVGIGAVGVAANRFAASRWLKYNDEVPSTRQVDLKL